MLGYAVKRLLLVVPTLFFVSLVIFLVLNMAPGNPGEAGLVGQGEHVGSQTQKESYRLFREQFHLDKPILFNTHFALPRKQVREWLVTAHGLDDGGGKAAARMRAQKALDDGGAYLVRHLIALLNADPEPRVRRLAVLHLAQAAQGRLYGEWTGDGEKMRTRNRQVSASNQRLRRWIWEADASPAFIERVVAQWNAWWKGTRDDYTYTKAEALRIFFTDTRFFWYWRNLLRLDFGLSTVDRRPVLPVVVSKLKYSLSLTFVSVVLAYLVAVPLGVISAVRQHTLGDTIVTTCLFVLYSVPTFFTATVLLRLLSAGSPWTVFPTGGFASANDVPRTTLQHLLDVVWHLLLPVVTYASATLAVLSRYARAGVIEVIRADYIRTARAKGLHEVVVIVKHAARNGMLPILTLLGSLLPVLVSGSVVIEVVFGIPGMGLYLYDAINLRDYNAVMAVLVLASVLTLLGILLSDLAYALVDPRIDFGASGK